MQLEGSLEYKLSMAVRDAGGKGLHEHLAQPTPTLPPGGRTWRDLLIGISGWMEVTKKFLTLFGQVSPPYGGEETFWDQLIICQVLPPGPSRSQSIIHTSLATRYSTPPTTARTGGELRTRGGTRSTTQATQTPAQQPSGTRVT